MTNSPTGKFKTLTPGGEWAITTDLKPEHLLRYDIDFVITRRSSKLHVVDQVDNVIYVKPTHDLQFLLLSRSKPPRRRAPAVVRLELDNGSVKMPNYGQLAIWDMVQDHLYQWLDEDETRLSLYSRFIGEDCQITPSVTANVNDACVVYELYQIDWHRELDNGGFAKTYSDMDKKFVSLEDYLTAVGARHTTAQINTLHAMRDAGETT